MAAAKNTVTYKGRKDGAPSASVLVKAKGADARTFPLGKPVTDVPDSIVKAAKALDDFNFDFTAVGGAGGDNGK